MSAESSSVNRVSIDKLIDALIRLGFFESRDEALSMVSKLEADGLEDLAAVLRVVEALVKLEKELGRVPIGLDGALEELLKERER